MQTSTVNIFLYLVGESRVLNGISIPRWGPGEPQCASFVTIMENTPRDFVKMSGIRICSCGSGGLFKFIVATSSCSSYRKKKVDAGVRIPCRGSNSVEIIYIYIKKKTKSPAESALRVCVCVCVCSPTLLKPQSHLGDQPVSFKVVRPTNGTAFLKVRSTCRHPSLTTSVHVRVLHMKRFIFVAISCTPACYAD